MSPKRVVFKKVSRDKSVSDCRGGWGWGVGARLVIWPAPFRWPSTWAPGTLWITVTTWIQWVSLCVHANVRPSTLDVEALLLLQMASWLLTRHSWKGRKVSHVLVCWITSGWRTEMVFMYLKSPNQHVRINSPHFSPQNKLIYRLMVVSTDTKTSL